MGTAEDAHNAATTVQVPECHVAGRGSRSRHDTVFASVMTRAHPIRAERDAVDGSVRISGLDLKNALVGEYVGDDQGTISVCNGHQGQGGSWFHAGNSAAVGGRWQDGVDQLSSADIPDLDPTVLSSNKDLVQERRHAGNTSSDLVAPPARSHGVDRGVVLKGRGLEDLNPRGGCSNDPGAKDNDLLDGLIDVGWQRELIDLLASLEHPEALCLATGATSPCGQDLLFPGIRSRDIKRCLGSSYEDEVEATAQVVCLETFANRGRDLEGSLAERNGREWDTCGRNEADSLDTSQFSTWAT